MVLTYRNYVGNIRARRRSCSWFTSSVLPADKALPGANPRQGRENRSIQQDPIVFAQESTMTSPLQARKHSRPVRLRYKRNYMRRWRARPENFDRERANRQRAYLHRKLTRRGNRGLRLCGFCQLRPSIGRIVRLRPVGNGYAEMRVPYCGQC